MFSETWLYFRYLSEYCIYGQYDIQPVVMCKELMISSLHSLSSSSQNTLQMVSEKLPSHHSTDLSFSLINVIAIDKVTFDFVQSELKQYQCSSVVNTICLLSFNCFLLTFAEGQIMHPTPHLARNLYIVLCLEDCLWYIENM